MTENNQPNFYDVVKLCKGGLVLDLPAFDSSAINRVISFKHDVEKIRVPRIYALGVFVDPTLEQMYKEGYFRIEPARVFEKEVSEIFFPVENKVAVIETSVILDALKKGNRQKIKEWLNSGTVNKDNIITIAREHIGDLTSSMIKDLEKILGIELEVENEQD